MSILRNKQITRYLQGILCFALIFVFLGQEPAYGQNKINSPYSMFGPGEIKGNEYFRNMSMGGLAQGFRTNLSVNYINPASYTAIDSLSFIFDGTVFSHFYQQKLADNSQVSNYSTLGNFNFGFPVTKWWRMAAGILPYSQLGYDISEFSTDNINGRVNYYYRGNGGINQVYIGHGFKVLPSLSLGFNASYLFGKVQDVTIVASDSVGFYRSIWSYSDNIDGLMLNYGAQWHQKIKNDASVSIGLTYTHETLLNMSQNRTLSRDLPGQTALDTLSFITGDQGKMKIPAKIGAGAFFVFNKSWSGGIDFETQSWSAFETFENLHNLNDTYQFRVGTIYNPRIETFSSIFNRLEYKAGFRYGKSFLNLQNQDFNEFGISFGIGLPMRRSLSGLNIGFEFAQRSANDPGLIKENYFRFNFGLNVYERWFLKRRFF